jgi:hypothetical protein
MIRPTNIFFIEEGEEQYQKLLFLSFETIIYFELCRTLQIRVFIDYVGIHTSPIGYSGRTALRREQDDGFAGQQLSGHCPAHAPHNITVEVFSSWPRMDRCNTTHAR